MSSKEDEDKDRGRVARTATKTVNEIRGGRGEDEGGDDCDKDCSEDSERKTRRARMRMRGEDGNKVKTTQEDLGKCKKKKTTKMTVVS